MQYDGRFSIRKCVRHGPVMRQVEPHSTHELFESYRSFAGMMSEQAQRIRSGLTNDSVETAERLERQVRELERMVEGYSRRRGR